MPIYACALIGSKCHELVGYYFPSLTWLEIA